MEESLADEIAGIVNGTSTPGADTAASLIARLKEAMVADPSLCVLRDELMAGAKKRVQENPSDANGRFFLGVLYKELRLLDHAIEQFQETRKVRDLLLQSYLMLGCCFAEKKGFNMEDLAIKQFRKGVETAGYEEREYLPLQYDLAMLLVRRAEYTEACRLVHEIHRVEQNYRDVGQWVEWCEGGNAPVPDPSSPHPPAGAAALDLPLDPLNVITPPHLRREEAG